MRRLAACVAVIAVCVVGCKKESKEAAQAPAPEQEQRAEAAAPEPEPEKAEAAAPPAEEFKPTAEHAQKYAKFYLADTDLAVEFKKKADARIAEMKTAGSAALGLSEIEKLKKEYEAKRDSVRDSHGLSADEYDAVHKAAEEVLNRRRMWLMGGGEQSLKQLRANEKSVPADRKAEWEQQVASMEAAFTSNRDVKDERAKYGDAFVDAIIAQEGPLKDAWERRLKVAF